MQQCSCQSFPDDRRLTAVNNTSRNDLLKVLVELSGVFPDWRFGQLVANVATAARGPQVEAIWDSEDDELLAAACRLLERNRDRMQIGAENDSEPDGAGFSAVRDTST